MLGQAMGEHRQPRGMGASFIVIMNTAIDLVHAVLDPRVRLA
jgi:hypothetical protein